MLNFLMVIFAIICVVLGIVLFKVKHIGKNSMISLIVVGVLVFILSQSFVIIKTGYTGVKTTFGQVDSKVLQNGFNGKIPFVQSIKIINNKQQDKKYEGEIWGEANDKTAVFAKDVIISYYINPEKSAYIYANVNNYKDGLIPQTLVNSAVKSAMVQLSSNDVTNRNKVETLARTSLEKAVVEKYGSDTVVILKVTIDNMDFEDSYNRAIAEKQIARQQAEKQAIENQKSIDMAEANQKKALVDAETKKIAAQGDADAMIIAAEAEAQAYKIKSAEITENLLKKWELDARKEHGWVTIQGANAIVTGQ